MSPSSSDAAPHAARRSPRALARDAFYDTLDRWPRGYVAWRRRRHPEWPLVTPDHDLVVEGYPASANSFVREVVREANPGIRVASHAHASAQVREGLRLGIPVIVLVRPAGDAVASIVLRRPDRDPRRELGRWFRFHDRLRGVFGKVVAAPFDVAVNRPASVVRAVGERFGGDLRVPTTADVHAATQRLQRWDAHVFGDAAAAAGATPDPERTVRREVLAARLEEGDLARLLARCEALHAEIVSHAIEWQA